MVPHIPGDGKEKQEVRILISSSYQQFLAFPLYMNPYGYAYVYSLCVGESVWRPKDNLIYHSSSTICLSDQVSPIGLEPNE